MTADRVCNMGSCGSPPNRLAPLRPGSGEGLGEEIPNGYRVLRRQAREKVQIPESEVRKTTYEREGKDGKKSVAIVFRATLTGTRLDEVRQQEDWGCADAPIE